MKKQLILWLCFICSVAVVAQKTDTCIKQVPVFWSSRMDKVWDKAKYSPLHIVGEPIESTYNPGQYRYVPGGLTAHQTVFRTINDAKKEWCIIDGLNVIPSKQNECAIIKPRRKYFLFGKKIWRVRVFSKEKIERKAQTMHVKTFLFL